ncbi:MAG: hypothetical protein QXG97_02110 [Nitrososphaerota archaeon]
MNRRTLLALTMTFALAFSGISLYLFATRGGEPVDSSRDRAIKVAVEFIRSSPTFQFDGIPETLMLKDYNLLESVPPKHVVTVVFYCRQSGYGNRTGQVLAQVITHHEAVITVVDSTVTSAVIDQIWDEINQRILRNHP